MTFTCEPATFQFSVIALKWVVTEVVGRAGIFPIESYCAKASCHDTCRGAVQSLDFHHVALSARRLYKYNLPHGTTS